MITYQEIDRLQADGYDKIEMKVDIREIYEVFWNDLGGISFQKTAVSPYVKDFNTIEVAYGNLKAQFSLDHVHVFMAFDGSTPVAGAILCYDTPDIHMLDGRRDLGVLWDIRVDSRYKRGGVGQRLFNLVKEEARELGLRQLKIECQSDNVPAVDFYLKQNAQIGGINRYAYCTDEELSDEIQLLLYLDL